MSEFVSWWISEFGILLLLKEFFLILSDFSFFSLFRESVISAIFGLKSSRSELSGMKSSRSELSGMKSSRSESTVVAAAAVVTAFAAAVRVVVAAVAAAVRVNNELYYTILS